MFTLKALRNKETSHQIGTFATCVSVMQFYWLIILQPLDFKSLVLVYFLTACYFPFLGSGRVSWLLDQQVDTFICIPYTTFSFIPSKFSIFDGFHGNYCFI